MNNKIKRMAFSAMIAAIYFLMCFVQQGFASNAIQCRLSEGLTILPLFFSEAIMGVSIGCLFFNLLHGSVYDVIFGTLATLLAALCTHYVGKLIKNNTLKFIVGASFPVLFNAFVVPFLLINGAGVADGYFYLVLTVGIGQLIACYGFGYITYFAAKHIIFKHVIK